MATILNLSAYRFVALADLPGWRARVRVLAEAEGLKGTVLLAPEGINLFLAGAEAPARRFLQELAAHPPFAGLTAKESWSEAVPFARLLVKVKPEIIRMNQPTIRPDATPRAPAVDPATLARWLDIGTDDAGRDLLLLDTRNAFEFDHGRFQGAQHWQLGKFSDFPAALAAHRDGLAGKTVVTYCTGGIRCEKAALLMAETGVGAVFQLDGGILDYLAATGGRHFEGHCFVFDDRRLLADTLLPCKPPDNGLHEPTTPSCSPHGRHAHDSSLAAHADPTD